MGDIKGSKNRNSSEASARNTNINVAARNILARLISKDTEFMGVGGGKKKEVRRG